MTSEEISVELKGLLELKQLGFVLEDEYERRKKLLLKLTPYSSKCTYLLFLFFLVICT